MKRPGEVRLSREEGEALIEWIEQNALSAEDRRVLVQVRRLFFRLVSERGEGTIEIHRSEGEQSQEGFLVDQRENVCYPRMRAAFGLGQNEIQVS